MSDQPSTLPPGTPIYRGGRFPALLGKGLCRGCGHPVNEFGQQTWHKACKALYHPVRVRSAVNRRDKWICQGCGFDIGAARRAWKRERYSDDPSVRRAAIDRGKPKAEYDHIVPFSEGGLTVLENMQTLCRECHRAKTAAWRREKAEKRRAAK